MVNTESNKIEEETNPILNAFDYTVIALLIFMLIVGTVYPYVRPIVATLYLVGLMILIARRSYSET